MVVKIVERQKFLTRAKDLGIAVLHALATGSPQEPDTLYNYKVTLFDPEYRHVSPHEKSFTPDQRLDNYFNWAHFSVISNDRRAYCGVYFAGYVAGHGWGGQEADPSAYIDKPKIRVYTRDTASPQDFSQVARLIFEEFGINLGVDYFTSSDTFADTFHMREDAQLRTNLSQREFIGHVRALEGKTLDAKVEQLDFSRVPKSLMIDSGIPLDKATPIDTTFKVYDLGKGGKVYSIPSGSQNYENLLRQFNELK